MCVCVCVCVSARARARACACEGEVCVYGGVWGGEEDATLSKIKQSVGCIIRAPCNVTLVPKAEKCVRRNSDSGPTPLCDN